MKSRLYITIVFSIISFVANARFSRLFTIESGLSSSLVYSLYKDSRGCIWISTGDGLNRYDGANFIHYRSNGNDSTSLLSNNVFSVHENSDGKIYVLSTNGLQTFDYATDSFKTIVRAGEGYNNRCLLIRKDGSMLIGTSGYGVKKLNVVSGRTEISSFNSKFDDYNINSMVEDNDGNLWIATENNGLVKLDASGNESHYSQVGNDVLSSVNSCNVDLNGNVYISSIGNGVYVYDKPSHSFRKIYSTRYPINCMVQRGENMLIGTDGDGIIDYNTVTGDSEKANFSISDVNLLDSKVFSIIFDDYDNLWIGIYQKGVAFIPATTNKFNYIGSRSTLKNNIGDKCVTAVTRSEDGKLFVGTDNDGLYVLDSNYDFVSHLFSNLTSGNSSKTIMCLLDDSYGRIWAGSYLDGLSYLPKGGKIFKKVSFGKENAINVNSIFAMAEDGDNRLWVGTMGSGLYYINLDEPDTASDVLHIGSRIVRCNDNLNSWINSLCYSQSRNMLYIGTADGIKCLDLSKGYYTSVRPVFKGTSVISISQDVIGNIWIGTVDGIKVLDKDLAGVLAEYGVDDGLPSNNIASITSDKSGNMWISTNRGIAKYEFNTGMFTSFRTSEGLYNNEFSIGAFYNDCNGNVYFGGTNGIVYFNPEEIKSEPTDFNIRITAFYLHNKPVNKSTMSGKYRVIDDEIYNETEINLSYDDSSFRIEFAADNFSIPHDFEYSLGGEVWNSLQPGTSSIFFSNLPVGKYKFMVRSKGMKNDLSAKTLDIVIHPAWYASVWAKLLYSLVVILIVIFILYQVRLRYLAHQEMMEHKLQEEANEAKLQFFINITHEIRTPISLIISPLHKLISSDNDPSRQKSYSLIERNAERILSLVNQLMDIRKIDKQQMRLRFSEVDLIGFIKDTIDIFSYQAGCKGVTMNVISDKDRLDAWIDPNNFDKVILNLLSNSFKHVPAGGGEINIYINSGTDDSAAYPLDNYIEIIVEDNGTGIKEEEISHIFERFYQVADDSAGSSGTGIGLHLAMSLVKLHHGTINVSNNADKPGCRFIVRIPLGKGHLSESEIFDNKIWNVNKNLSDIKALVYDSDSHDDSNKKTVRKKYTVLIADDDEEIRNYLASELGDIYRIVQCKDGKEALDVVMFGTPDIVLSDVMMPVIDGMTLLKKIKQNIKVNHIPVVLLTARSSNADNIEGLQYGADAFLAKPFSIDLVKTTIGNLLKNREILKNNFSGGQEANMEYIHPETADERLMKRVVKAIIDNIGNPELNVEMIAREVGISRVHLYRKLKELTNQSTRDFIRNTRLKQAEALLVSGKDYNISEIAMSVGFGNATYFSNAFKELYGMSPSKYAEKYREEKSESDDDGNGMCD